MRRRRMMTAGARAPGVRLWPGALAWALWALAMLGLAATAWFDHLLRQAGRPDLIQLDAGGVTVVLGAVSAASAGAVLASRRPRHPVGWLLLAFGLVAQALTSAAEGYARYGFLARPGALPATSQVATLASATFIPGLGCVGFILLLTPTGSLPSSSARWRWWAWVAAAVPAAFGVSWLLGVPQLDPDSPLHAVGNPFAIPALADRLRPVYGSASPATALTLVVAAGSLVLRFRRAGGLERQQLRWLTLAAALAPLAVVVAAAGIVTAHLAVAGWAAGLYRPCSVWPSARRSCGTACTTWTASSAGPWPTGCSRCCWAAATPAWSWGSASCSAGTPPWWSPGPPWPRPPRSSRPAAASRPWSTGASTGAATTPPARSPRSAPGCASRSTWTP